MFPGAGRCAWLRAGSSEQGQHCSRGAASPPDPPAPCGCLAGHWLSGRQVPAATAQAGSSTGSERLRCGCRTCPLSHPQGGPGEGRGPSDPEGLLHRPLHPPLPLRGREGAARIGVTLQVTEPLPAPHVFTVLGGPPFFLTNEISISTHCLDSRGWIYPKTLPQLHSGSQQSRGIDAALWSPPHSHVEAPAPNITASGGGTGR